MRTREAAPGFGVPFARCLPDVNVSAPADEEFNTKAANQCGFVTFGAPHVISVMFEAYIRALEAVWYQKWMIHRRLRPEEYAGRRHAAQVQGVQSSTLFNPNLLNADVFATNLNDPTLNVLAHNRIQNANRQSVTNSVVKAAFLNAGNRADGASYLLPQELARDFAGVHCDPTMPNHFDSASASPSACLKIRRVFTTNRTRINLPASTEIRSRSRNE